MDISRIVAGRLRMQLATVDLGAVIHAALDAVRPDVAAAGLALDVTVPAEVLVIGDPIRLQQVVATVLANAIKFSPRVGRIEMRLEAAGDSAAIVVTDTGRGIAPEFLPHVFEPFRQADDVKRRKTGGLGLGLTIVKNLVAHHRGQVSVVSAGEGRGTTLTIVLPLAGSSHSTVDVAVGLRAAVSSGASVPSPKFVTYFAEPRRPWRRCASSEYSRYVSGTSNA